MLPVQIMVISRYFAASGKLCALPQLSAAFVDSTSKGPEIPYNRHKSDENQGLLDPLSIQGLPLKRQLANG
jgi:hypothetical protein